MEIWNNASTKLQEVVNGLLFLRNHALSFRYLKGSWRVALYTRKKKATCYSKSACYNLDLRMQ
jgi:hypothetical protein